MVHGKIMNIIQICLVIFVVSAIAFRSLLAGVIVLTPLLLAVCAVFGVMGLAGIPLNIPNSLISAMAVGIGADYAIYLLYRMREQVAKGADAEAAVRATLATAGKACLFVATAVAGGYAVLMLSIGYNVHLWLALFIILAMLVSALASLTLVPGLVLSLRPAFIFGRASGGTKALATASMLMLAVGAVGTSPTIARAEALTPSAIMEKSLSATKVRDSIADATFTLINKDGEERVRRTNGYTKLQDNGNDNMRTVRFLSPGDIKGTATLLIEHAAGDDDMWIYLPALKKVRRLVASNKKDSFVGTEFSYGDVIGHRTSDWTHRILREEAVAGAPTYVIESLPKNDEVKNNTGYSKRVSWVRKDNFIAVRTDFWDIGGQPLKTVTARRDQGCGHQCQVAADGIRSGKPAERPQDGDPVRGIQGRPESERQLLQPAQPGALRKQRDGISRKDKKSFRPSPDHPEFRRGRLNNGVKYRLDQEHGSAIDRLLFNQYNVHVLIITVLYFIGFVLDEVW